MEQTVRQRLRTINEIKEQNPVCIGRRIRLYGRAVKSQILEEEKLVDLVVGPDAYRSLPELLVEAEGGQKKQ